MALTKKQERFIAAFLGSARRNPVIASVMAGMNLTKKQAMALLENEDVRAEIERLNMNAIVVDGKLIDVEPGKLNPTDALGSLRKRGRNKLRQESQGFLKTNLQPLSERLKGTSLPADTVYTEDGEVAGTVEETLKRVSQVNPNGNYLFSITSGSTALDAHLDERFAAMRREQVTHVSPEGELQIVTKVKTRYEIKLFFSQIMGDAQYNIQTRMGAAALLGKSLGLYSEKIIQEEYNRENKDEIGEGDDLMKQLDAAKVQLQKIRDARAVPGVQSVSVAPASIAPAAKPVKDESEGD